MSLSYLPNVTTLQFDRELCTGCGMCVEVCPHAVFRLEADHAVLADRDACIECGACMTNCEAGALQVRAGVGCAAAILVSAPPDEKAAPGSRSPSTARYAAFR